MSSHASHSSPVAQRYSSALFELAYDKKVIDKVSASLQSLQATINGNKDLQSVLTSPALSVEAVSNVMAAVLKGIKADPLTKNAVLLMVQKRRAAAIIDLAPAFQALVAKSKGELTAYVTAATPLTPAQELDIGTMLAAKFKSVVRPVVSIDSSLIGGLTVQVGSQLIDASLKTKLSSLQLSLKGA